jgi:hypothetical protein
MLSEKTIQFSREFASVFLGADALYRAHPNGDGIGLVIMNLAEGLFEPVAFADIDDALVYLLELQYQSTALPEVDRRLFYQQLCHTTSAILKWLRDGLPFPDRIRDFLHVPGQQPTDETLDSYRARMHALLTQMGYSGDLKAQCAAWEQRNRVPVDEVQQVMEALLDEGWDRTNALIPIPADKSDGLRVVTLSSDHFNARCDYRARVVEINIDPVITRPALKHLVVHEAYPGHYLQFKMRETHFHNGTGAAEAMFSMLKSPSSCMFEGVADAGLVLLDWFDGDDDRLMMLMNRYQAGIAAEASWRLHQLGWPQDSVRDWLREHCLIGGDAWVSHRMGYISPKQRGMHIWSYWRGEGIVESVWSHTPAADRPAFLQYVYSRLHSPQTLRLFAQ